MAERLEQDERQPVFVASRESTPKSDALASTPTENQLSEVSEKVSSQYRKLLTHLGTPLEKIESLLKTNLGNAEETCFKGLVHWLRRNGNSATWAILLEAIEKGAERKDYADRLRQKLLEQRPGVADGDVPGAELVARFAILTANDNEWESAKYFMGAAMSKCKITSALNKHLTEKSHFSRSFEADKISRTFVRDFKIYSFVKVCGVLGVLTTCSKIGSHVTGSSRDTVTALLETACTQKWELEAVFIVGCCGCSSRNNIDLGAVLIANPILQYAGKHTSNGLEMPDVKNTCSPTNSKWLAALKTPNSLPQVDEELKVQYLTDAPILSGDFLVKCEELAENYRKTKLESDADLLGFEMEGAGGYATRNQDILPPNRKQPYVLIVKGVSDSANSDKNAPDRTAFFKETLPDVDKDSRQQMCTMMSLMIVFRAIKAKLAA